MRLLLIIKHWHVFLLLMIGIGMQNLSIEDSEIQTALLNMVGALIYFLWPMAVVHGLRIHLPYKMKFGYHLYTVSSIAWLSVFSLSMMVTDWRNLTLDGLNPLPLILVSLVFVYFLIFPAKIINTIEKGKNATFGHILLDFFLILLLPIGIWLLQPRINNILRNIPESKRPI